MNPIVKVSYDAKSRRLVMVCPFFLADAMRNFPSRRFDPKSKSWKVPLTAANVRHMEGSRKVIGYKLSEEAQNAIANLAKLSAGPTVIPFPHDTYGYERSLSGFSPMDHQKRMLDRSWGLSASAWIAKMGTGKTFAAVHLACARFLHGQINRVVIICPSTLRTTWRKELAKYATVPYDFRIHETKAGWYEEWLKDDSRRSGRLQILAVSVEGLGVSPKLYESVCSSFVGRDVLAIVDESSRIKNNKALRTGRAILLGGTAKYRMILNGTPIAIGMEDLWAQYEFLDPNILGCGDYWSYKTRYVELGGFEGKNVIGYKNVEELMSLIEPYTVEVGKDVLNLPPKVMKVRYIEATKEQKALLKLIKKGTSPDPAAPLIKVQNSLERNLRFRQVVGGWLPRQNPETEETTLEPLKENPKMDAFLEMVDDNWKGTKFIIWSTFKHELEHIATQLQKRYGENSGGLYYGATSKEERSNIEDKYCNDKSFRWVVANPATAGLGLTFISGENDVMVYYSGTSAYIDRAQSEDRSHRIGQQNSVTVVDMVMENTIDEVTIESIAAKMDVEEYIMTRLKEGKEIRLEG